tara:strand:- start:3147 stop:3890 length:744 start_codon:yes stop_codon:yes gene_type:complete
MSNKYDLSRSYDLVKDKILMPSRHYLKIIEIINKITKYNQSDKKFLSVLDFGCGQGLLLKLLENYNYDLYGYDFSKELVEIASQITNKSTIYNELPLDKKYDVIILSEVLEHLQDPLSILKVIKDKLNDNGYLIITVPNADRFNLGYFLHDKHQFQPIYDVMYTFSEISLILKLASFRMIYWEGIGPIFLRYRKNKNLFFKIIYKILYEILYPPIETFFKAVGLFHLRSKQLLVVSRVDKNIVLNID